MCVDYRKVNGLACVLTMGNSMDNSPSQGGNLTKGHNSVTLLDKIMYFYGIKT